MADNVPSNMDTANTGAPSFPRWILRVLAPVYVVYGFALALIDVHLYSWMPIQLYISLNYGPAFVFWLAKTIYKRIFVALMSSFFVLCIEVVIVSQLPTDTSYVLSFQMLQIFGQITGELGDSFLFTKWIVMAALAGAVCGLALTMLQWVVLAFPEGTALRWLSAHVLGAGVGAITVALTLYWTISVDAPMLISKRMWLWSLLSPFAAIPHLYLTWRVLALSHSMAKKSWGRFSVGNPIARSAYGLVAGYVLIVIGRIAADGAAWDALIWPYDDVRQLVFGPRLDDPDGKTPVHIGKQEYLIPAELVAHWEPDRRRESFRYLSLRIPAGLVIAGDSGSADIDNIVLENEYINVDMKNSMTHLFWFVDDGLEKQYLCKRQYKKHLTVCWHKEAKFELFKIPFPYDYETSMTYGRTDGVVLYRSDGPDAHVLAFCTEIDRQCSARFDDGAVGVTVRFAWTLQPLIRAIVAGVERNLGRFRARADAFRQAAD